MIFGSIEYIGHIILLLGGIILSVLEVCKQVLIQKLKAQKSSKIRKIIKTVSNIILIISIILLWFILIILIGDLILLILTTLVLD